MPPINYNEDFDIEIRLNERFNDIHSLGYALIDLQAITSSTTYVTNNNEFKGKRLPSTVRTFSKKYKDTLKLKKFSQGSFIATVATGVVTGIILKFLDKYFDNNEVQQIHNHVHIHNQNNLPIQVRFENQEIEDDINRILDNVEIVPDDITQSLENTLHAINNSDLLGNQQISYSHDGLIVLSQDINRLGVSLNLLA